MLRRLVKTSVEYGEDEDFQGISALVSEALMNKRYRESGKIYYAFGKGLSQLFSACAALPFCAVTPRRRCSSKYAVTLYEILEVLCDIRRDTGIVVSIEEFRSWLTPSEDAYSELEGFEAQRGAVRL